MIEVATILKILGAALALRFAYRIGWRTGWNDKQRAYDERDRQAQP